MNLFPGNQAFLHEGNGIVNTELIKKISADVYAQYRSQTPKSELFHTQASDSLIDGVSGSHRYYPPYPVYMKKAKGPSTTDIDDNVYLDFALCNGPLLLGHACDEVINNVSNHLNKGLLFSNPSFILECAELLKEAIPCAELVTFANSGTEAAIFAARAARAYTQKSKIVKFLGHYHGQDDQFLIGTGGANVTISAGIPESIGHNTIAVPFHDIDQIQALLDKDNDIAAVILDPQMTAGGLFPAEKSFYQEIRLLTEQKNVVLIFDEIVTGFRLAYGGAQEYFGVVPDLAYYGKGAASGGKFAALVGKKDIMDVFSVTHTPSTFHSGTYNDCTEGIISCITTLKILKQKSDEEAYTNLNILSQKFGNDLEILLNKNNIPCYINSFCSSLKIVFSDQQPGLQSYTNRNKVFAALFFLATMTNGLILSLPAPAGSGSSYLSFAHNEKDVASAMEKIERTITQYGFSKVF
jgi:glutamate-1-semialdehyde 2,1-aminomutase